MAQLQCQHRLDLAAGLCRGVAGVAQPGADPACVGRRLRRGLGPELQAPFLAVWYVLGMAVPVAVGALLGPRVLRW
jgi:hypothetical protein